MEHDDGLEEEGPFSRWLPPDDRLWRHPSEVAGVAAHRPTAAALSPGRTPRSWPLAIIAGMVGALLASGIGAVTGEFAGGTTVVRPQINQMTPEAMSTSLATEPNWPAIFDSLSPTMATIVANGDNGETTTSGVLWRTQGHTAYILTDEDSVNGARNVQVQLAGNGDSLVGHVVGSDEQTGVAVVSIPSKGVSTAFLGSVIDLRAGEPVATVAAEGASTQTAGPFASGLVSGTDRELQVSGGPTMLGMIAISSSGTVGGGAAVVEPDGAVVGITSSATAADSAQAGTTFAIPIDVAVRVANQIVNGSSGSHPWVGVVEATDLPSATASRLGVPGGAIVDAVMSPSPASSAGIKPDDVITSLNGAPVTSAASLLLLTQQCKMGRKITVGFVHMGVQKHANLDVVPQPQDVVP